MVAITALMVSGISVLATSHATLQQREADYALAMQLAEAGINYELRYVSTHLTSSPVAHLSGSAYQGSVPGVAGTFTTYVTNTDGTTNWAPPSAMTVVSTGTVNGISRTVTANCKGGGGRKLFDGKYTIFGYSGVTFSGASSAINGDLGANGPIVVKAGGNGSINGNVVLCGPSANLPGGNSVTCRSIIRQTDALTWPTIDTIVAATFPNGWSTLRSATQISAQSARMRTFVGNSPVVTVAGTKLAGWTYTSSLTNSMFNSLGVNTLILPPGDYYFTDIQISGNSKIICDTAALTVPGGTPGPVRIWVNDSTSQDTINCDVTFTTPNDPSKFRLYYNKASSISLGGNMPYYGGIYGVRAGANSAITAATISLAGGAKVTGEVIADQVSLTGGAVATGPSADMSDGGDFVIGNIYGFSDTWQEIKVIANGSVFADGTNR
ncbi:DUF7305 domain-containing protein [Fimbriimonas ginsengisoli]|uniref:DUF7305 domain-containing protein n=1 Tax=Fimbriimonas ginsengisoli TaxID=1005039 RepID=UPI001D0EB960|nr:hypothetical protein [Fimbriimonas ginsengisoli]